jgi:hypothetical protein
MKDKSWDFWADFKLAEDETGPAYRTENIPVTFWGTRSLYS